MTAKDLFGLTIEFQDERPDGLRLVTQAGSTVECLLCSRAALPRSLGDSDNSKLLDTPGVYLLIGPAERMPEDTSQHDSQLYVGQADSVADRLESHLKAEDKQWWKTVVVFKQLGKNPLNLTQCKFLESRLCSLAIGVGECVVGNKVSPQLPAISPGARNSTEDFLRKAIVIVTALGWNFFHREEPEPPKPVPSDSPTVSPQLAPVLEQIRSASENSSMPRARWYPTRTDYRAKCVVDPQFRVFIRVKVAKNWFRLELTDDDQKWYKVKTPADVDNLRKAIEKAYQKSEQYLQRGK